MASTFKGWDPDKLTPDQAKVAEMIISESRRLGVNPDITLAIAWLESRFDQKATSETGARGVMQLTQGTAKTLGVNRDDLEENIRGGVKYIDQLLKNQQVGYDPLKLVVAYHDGPNSKYFETGKADDISDRAVQYAHDFNVLTGGLINPEAAKGGAPAEAAPTQPSPDEIAGSSDIQIKELPSPSPDEKRQYGFSPDAMAAGATLVGPAGGVVGTYQAGRGMMDRAGRLVQAATQAAEGAASEGRPAGPPARGGAMPPPQGPASRTPVGGQGTFNYAKKFGLSDFDAARAANMSKQPGGSWDVARQVADAEAKIGPGFRMTPERADLLLPEQVGSGPRGAPTAPIPPVKPPRVSPLSRVNQAITQTVARHPILSGLMGGAGTGAMAAETAERYRTGDELGAGLGSVGTLGSAMSMFPKTAGPGTAMAVAAPLTMAITDYIRNRRNQPVTPLQLSEDMMKSLQSVEQGIRASIAKKKSAGVAPQEGFSLPTMAP